MEENNEFIELMATLYSKDYCEEEWVYVEYLRRLLELSPFAMCKALNEGKFCFESEEIAYIETNYDEVSQKKHDYFTKETLDDVKIHISTWRNFLEILGYVYFTPLNCNPNTTSKLEGAVPTFEPEHDTTIEFEEHLLESQVVSTQQTKTSAPESTTQVNADRWKASCKAACTLLVTIMEDTKTGSGIKRVDFLRMLDEKYSGKGGVHTIVENIAWAALPESRKHGAGCPKKKPENS